MNAAEDLSKIAKRRQTQRTPKGKRGAKAVKSSHDSGGSDSDAEVSVVQKCKDDGDVRYYKQR